MKARIIGYDKTKFINENEFTIEAHDIELIPDPPKERDVRDGDIGLHGEKGNPVIANDAIACITWLEHKRFAKEVPTVFFNALDLISAMQAARKAGRTQLRNGNLSLRADAGERSICFHLGHGSDAEDACVVDTKAAILPFAMELLGLCIEGQENGK